MHFAERRRVKQALARKRARLRYVNQALVAWAMRKFKRFKRHRVQASQFLQRLATECGDIFVHWQIGMTGVFA